MLAACNLRASISGSLEEIEGALRMYLSGALSIQQLLRCMYTSAPGRKTFIERSTASEDTKHAASTAAAAAAATTKHLPSQLSAFAALLHKALGAPAEGGPGGPLEGGPPIQQHPEEVVYAGICGVEFWLQHVQLLLSSDAAAAAAAASTVAPAAAAETASDSADEGPRDIAVACREMERLVTPVAAAAADSKVRSPAAAAAAAAAAAVAAAVYALRTCSKQNCLLLL